MKELERVLILHAARYPQMEPTDAVKLIYQNEFGGGHLVRDPEAFRRYLHREYEQTPHDPLMDESESIGNSLIRVNLAALEESRLEALALAFLESSRRHTGSGEAFLRKLDLLRTLTREGIFSFDPETLESYLHAYGEEGYPAVSHSEQYRRRYHPAYRIVRRELFT